MQEIHCKKKFKTDNIDYTFSIPKLEIYETVMELLNYIYLVNSWPLIERIEKVPEYNGASTKSKKAEYIYNKKIFHNNKL